VSSTHGLLAGTVSHITNSSESESYVTTDGQSASLSWNKASIWGLRPDFYSCQTIAGLLMCAALSDERTGLSFKITAGPRQRSYSRVRVPWDSRPYFTVSDSRLPFSLPPTTRREVFDPTSTRDTPSNTNELNSPFVTSGRTEYGSPSLTVLLLLRLFVAAGTCVTSVASRFLVIDHSGFQASSHNIRVYIY
jgi:hypothetical protein